MKSFKGVKKGQKFKVIGNSNNHNYPMGTILTIKRNIATTFQSFNDIAEEIHGNQIQIKDMELVSFNLKEMKESLDVLEKNYLKNKKELSYKIKFCEENDLDEYDENIFKVLKTLSTLKKNMSDIEKAKIIANLIKQ